MFNEHVISAKIEVVKINDLKIGDKILYADKCAKIIDIRDEITIQPMPSYDDIIIEIPKFNNFYKIIDCEMTGKFYFEQFNRECTMKEAFYPLIKIVEKDYYDSAEEYLNELILYSMEKFNKNRNETIQNIYSNFNFYLGHFNNETINKVQKFYGVNFKNIFEINNEYF